MEDILGFEKKKTNKKGNYLFISNYVKILYGPDVTYTTKFKVVFFLQLCSLNLYYSCQI